VCRPDPSSLVDRYGSFRAAGKALVNSNANASGAPFVSPSTKFRAVDTKATTLPFALMMGAVLSPFARAPPDLHDNVMAACRGALADFKVPREIRFVDEMPRSTLEKVAKAELRRMLA